MQRRLLRSERILVASPDYVRRMPKLREPEDITRHNCLTYWMGPDDVVWKFMRRNRLREIVVPSSFSSNNGVVLSDLAAAGHGIALLDDYTVAEEEERTPDTSVAGLPGDEFQLRRRDLCGVSPEQLSAGEDQGLLGLHGGERAEADQAIGAIARRSVNPRQTCAPAVRERQGPRRRTGRRHRDDRP